MSLFSFGKQQPFISADDEARIVEVIRAAERRTSGEVRVFIESHCRFVDPVDRAMEIFFRLKMEETELRNGVLVYIAFKDQQLAIFGDQGIYQKLGTAYWQEEVKKIIASFHASRIVEGIIEIVSDIGEVLVEHFPYRNEDKNELPDNIVFGR